MKRVSFVLLGLLGTAALAATTPRTPSPKGAEVYIISPKDGDTVSSPVVVRFGLKGMGVAPAGAQSPNTGHHHLLINTTYTTMDRSIPKDDRHIHLGGGQTEVEITLPAGRHRLQLLLGDYLHVPHNPPVMSKPITITVKP